MSNILIKIYVDNHNKKIYKLSIYILEILKCQYYKNIEYIYIIIIIECIFFFNLQ